MINVIDEALDGCQRALLILNAYEIQKESGVLTANDEALSIRMIVENLSGAIDKLKISEPRTEYIASKIETTTQNSFAARLRLALAHSGMTQAALAWGIGVSQSTISALVTGKLKEAGIVRARAIAEALEVNAQWLIYGEGKMQPAKFLTHNDEV
ncbi:helix-turn-helix domain-containing protein [Providencia sp. PROV132]|uniref:helix-turn-helix domain-containing protein n=1 Tax=Providencia sp. PROV132 TaxID=2949842 RepID=UPI0023494016|nr:helix-turn-helix domain-containing protein [Providencia sp. PROV132]